MTTPFKEAIAIKELLKDHPRGLSITEIATTLHLHRNTAARYLEMLNLKGEVDRKQIGTAKNYFLVQRMPVFALIAFCRRPVIILNARREVAMVNADALALLGCPLEVIYGEGIEDHPYPLFKDDSLLAGDSGIDLAIDIAQAITIQLHPATQAGLESWRHDQVEIANQTIRFLRQQVQMQGVTATQATSLGQILFRQQPVQLYLWQVTAILGQYVDTHPTIDWLRQADTQFAQGEEVQAFT